MKIFGLMPLKLDMEKSMISDACTDVERVCDGFIILWDTPSPNSANRIASNVTEYVTVDGGDGVWDDWSNRMALFARAAKYSADWCMLQDDDERLGPTLTRERVRELCETADAAGQVAVIVKVRTAWNDMQWRTDGIFGGQHKPLFVKNPLMLKNPNFMWTANNRLHALPRLEGSELWVDDYLIHYGMRTRSLREKNVAKYAVADPKNEFSPIPYDYLLQEDGMTLEPL